MTTGNAMTRERLRDGSMLAYWRATLPPGYVRSDEEIQASFLKALAERPIDCRDAWVFAYGSLIWNPAFEFVEQRTALARGWHRRFCVWTKAGRGSPETPGLALALDRGGSCQGVAFRLREDQVEDELYILWQREMASGVYDARWVDIAIPDDDVQGGRRKSKALTFVANRNDARFAGELDETEIARTIVTAHGALGSCLEYFTNTCAQLDSLGLTDRSLQRIRRHVTAASAGLPVAADER